MNPRAELPTLMATMFDGEMTDAEHDRLAELLRDDSRAQQSYLDLCLTHALLRRELGVIGIETQIPILDARGSEYSLPILSTTHYPQPTNFIGGPVFSYMVATVVLCLMLLGAWAYKLSHITDSQVVNNSRRSTISGPYDRVYVGRISGMKDCRWAETGEPTLLGASVALNRQYDLASGLLEITYKSGAKVILEGPCVYEVESSAGGFLERGKLAARIETKSENSSLIPHPSSLFFVRTPTALVTDLGTEFGVDVKKNGETQVHVFKGTVEAEWFDSNGAAGLKMVLTTGQAAGFDRLRTAIVSFPLRPQEFVRDIPKAAGPVADVALKKTIINWSGVYRYGDPTKGTSDWATWDRFGVWHVNDGVTDEAKSGDSYWLGRERTPNEFFIVYLRGRYRVERIELMNTHNGPGNDRGTKDFEIWAADEIDQNKKMVSPRLVLKGTLPCRFGAGADIPYDVFSADEGDFERFNARYVKFVAKTFYESEDFGGCGLNEIRLFAVPADTGKELSNKNER